MATLLVPIGAAGTEQEPEMIDHPGNVIYHEYYPGSQDHAYLDVLGMWWTHDAAADRVSFHLKGVDFEDFSGGTPPDVKVQCWVAMEIAFPDKVTRLGLRWSQYTYGGAFVSDVNITQAPQPSVPLAHEMTKQFGAPGYMIWSVDRQLLLRYGDKIAAPQATCMEEYFPAGIDPSQTVAGTVKIVSSSPVANRNPTLESEAVLDLTTLVRTSLSDVDEQLAGKGGMRGAEASSGKGSTPSVGPLALIGILLLVMILRRRDA